MPASTDDRDPPASGRLVVPDPRYRESFLDALAEHHGEGVHSDL
ncbi:hypothetical protein SAMN05192558_11615 [Actinokineospora alba]|uniref:Uncharacterized protein n=1 Tax=Actinokineospora alba TaxID=504798 RepID=A0A1H0VXD7_9PSEU|nr:hypothetical protein [Actinokineospora alba]TDP67140.1 hypothetical protein C8E96_2660 [Actinokineospora alba]SDJ45939.1 hypothetical protein SAMN05421871_11616 [Actinokineospora alba]SDP82941.1 hypothetical protein SAMN05192558_11615 [Actinokineospora alba]